jgi:hypothetical protein
MCLGSTQPGYWVKLGLLQVIKEPTFLGEPIGTPATPHSRSRPGGLLLVCVVEGTTFALCCLDDLPPGLM